MKKLLMGTMLLLMFAAASAFALPTGSFYDQATGWLNGHKDVGISDFNALVKKTVEPCAPVAAIDTTVTPALKAKKVRVWGTMMLPVFKSWGLNVAELDFDAAEKGDLPDVVFVTQAPGYFQGDVELMCRLAEKGVHVVTLSATNAWSDRLARRLGQKYDGVLTIGPAAKGGASFATCGQLLAGLPQNGRPDAAFAPLMDSHRMHSMYLTGDRCLMGLVDVDQGRVATAVAQYPMGRGGFTLFGPVLYETPNEPVCKRLLLNLIDLKI